MNLPLLPFLQSPYSGRSASLRAHGLISRRDLVKGLAGAAGLAALPAAADCPPRDELFFEVAKLELKVKGLNPAHDGLVVAQLSDIHVGSGVQDERVKKAVEAMNAAKPDLAVLTGDYVTTKRDPFERVPQLLKGIEAPTYAVLGNHDHLSNGPYLKWRLEGVGYAVLQNQHTTLQLKGADFTVLGVDDSTTRRDDLEKTLKGAPKGSRLMLAHTPSFVRKLPANEGLLCLSGHTHGGQLHVPALTEGLFRGFGQPYVRGHHAVNGNQLYVNRGLGFGRGTRLPRLDAEPELSLITLRAV